jgi:hypothetical protein
MPPDCDDPYGCGHWRDDFEVEPRARHFVETEPDYMFDFTPPQTKLELFEQTLAEAWDFAFANAHCEQFGHDTVDVSTAGPDSGNMDHECRTCGRYWSVPLY